MYRSSYKNARRLAATETNMAYRTADYERWQQLDFIVGIKIQLSNNHTCLGKDGKPHPFYDICDELKGTYPKDFKFTGWHPHCRCIATTIMKTPEEMAADDEAIMRGEQPSDPDESDNAVKELPDNFKQWVEDNEERIERAKSLPYFLRDNEMVINNSGNIATSLQTNEEIPKSDVVPDERGRFIELSVSEIKDNLRELSQNYTHEEAYIVLEDGRVFYKRGDEKEVNFTRTELAMFKGATVYHNHNDETISPGDIALLYTNKLKRVHAITANIDYIIEAPQTFKPYSANDILIDLNNKAALNLMKRLKKMNSLEADAARPILQELQIKELCNLLGVKYIKRVQK